MRLRPSETLSPHGGVYGFPFIDTDHVAGVTPFDESCVLVFPRPQKVLGFQLAETGGKMRGKGASHARTESHGFVAQPRLGLFASIRKTHTFKMYLQRASNCLQAH